MSNNKYNNTSDIMDYLENELDNAKRTAFEQQMQEDPELSTEVEVHKKLREQLSEEAALYDIVNKAYEKHKEHSPELEKKASLHKVEEEKPQKPSRIRQLMPYIAVAAAAAVLLFFLPSMFKSTLDNANTTFASAETYKAPTHKGAEDDESRLKAYEAYNINTEEGYKKALPYFEKIEKKNPEDELLMGISHAKTQQYDQALNLLTPLSQQMADYPNKATQAQWEIIGIHLARGDTDKALVQTETYVKNAPPKNQQLAKKLLSQLKKIKK